jgi:hypothetical protein
VLAPLFLQLGLCGLSVLPPELGVFPREILAVLRLLQHLVPLGQLLGQRIALVGSVQPQVPIAGAFIAQLLSLIIGHRRAFFRRCPIIRA